jgi:hypothetical protein
MKTIILHVDNLFTLPNKKTILLYKRKFEIGAYVFLFMCKECEHQYNNLFDAQYCLHPKYYNIKSKL